MVILISRKKKNDQFLFQMQILCKIIFSINKIDVLTMASPLGPTLANVFLSHYEKEWLDSCSSFERIVYKRYVVDTFVLFSSKENVHFLVDYVNK